MLKDLDKKSLSELQDIADSFIIDPCDYCEYTDRCKHKMTSDGKGEPVYPPCADLNPVDWIDSDILIELIEKAQKDEEEDLKNV